MKHLHSLSLRLFNRPHAFDFDQAVCILQTLRPDIVPLGTGIDPKREAVRLCGPLAPLFPSSAIGSLIPGDAATPPVLHALLFGLGGPDGPLPYAWQEWLQQRRRLKDHGPAAFLDLFQHRLLGHLYRALNKHRVAPAHTPPQHSQVRPVLRALGGESSPWRDTRLPLAFTPLFANRRRPASGFLSLVRTLFGVEAIITPFQGRWHPLPPTTRSRLGRTGQNVVLGRTVVAGTHVWDQHTGIELTIGPLALDRYRDFSPDEKVQKQLLKLAGEYFGTELEVGIRLILKKAKKSKIVLTRLKPITLEWASQTTNSTAQRGLHGRL